MKIVENHKQVLDHVSTLYIIHFITSFLYNLKFPDFLWLTFTAIFVVLTTLIGEYVCVKFENKAIFNFGGMLDKGGVEEVKKINERERKNVTELSHLI